MSALNGTRAADCWKQIGILGDRTCPELTAYLHCRNCPVYSARAAQLLDAELSADELTRRAQHYATPKMEERVGTRAVVIFRLGAEWLALPVAVWCEVAPPRPIHSLPHRRDQVVTGVVNVRGELLVCVSLAVALGVEPGLKGAFPRFAVIQRASDRFVFPTDEIVGLHRYGTEDITPSPATLAHTQAACTNGMLTLENRTVGVLDADRLFQIFNQSLA